MKLFNKTAIAISLSIVGAVSSVSALAMATDNTQLQEVEIIVDGDKNMNVFVSVDGEITTADVSASAMSDPEELRKLLVDVPDDIREKLVESLLNARDDNGNLKMVVDGDVGINQELHWISEHGSEGEHSIEVIGDNDEKKVIVMEFDHKFDSDVAQKVIKKIKSSSRHNNVKAIHHKKIKIDSLMSMIESNDFTADELNKIQQALDAKR